MVLVCIVPDCPSKHEKEMPRPNYFLFPKDETLKKIWIESIPKENLVIRKYTRICHLHFDEKDIVREASSINPDTGKLIVYPINACRLVPNAVPKIFQSSQNSSASQTETHMTLDIIKEDLILNSFWHFLDDKTNRIIIVNTGEIKTTPKIYSSVIIDSDLKLTVNINDVQIHNLGKNIIPSEIYDVQSLKEILDKLESLPIHNSNNNPDDAQLIMTLQLILSLLSSIKDHTYNVTGYILFLIDQVKLILNRKNLSYSPNYLIFSSLLHSISSAAYSFLRKSGNIILPSITTIRKLTLHQSLSPSIEQKDNLFLNYIRQKFTMMTCDKKVNLLLDEIHLQEFFDYKAGNIVGASFDGLQAAKTAFVFMLTGVVSDIKEVVHIIPSKNMTAELLYDFIKKTIIGLEEIGFHVLTIIMDNNAINGKAMSYFSDPKELKIVYSNPASGRPLFFLFDSVHILKCIRNNWLNLKSYGNTFQYPAFNFDSIDASNSICKASFTALRELFEIDKNNLLKYAYTLSKKAISPSNFERQNVHLVLKIFNDYVIESLIELGSQFNISNHYDTAMFIKIIQTWWKIVNVKTPIKGFRYNDTYQNPVRSSEDIQIKFLNYFLIWLQNWKDTSDKSSFLTKETYTALYHTTHGLREVTQYLLSEQNLHYVLLGKFQTDPLEARFGQYRQLSGGKYNISIRQVFESEKKLRVMSVLELSCNNRKLHLKDFFIDWDIYEETNNNIKQIVLAQPTSEDINQSLQYLPVIFYIAGYCAYVVKKRFKNCTNCLDSLTIREGHFDDLNNIYITGISRGNLLYPSEFSIKIVLLSYLMFEKLSVNQIFMNSNCQRKMLTELVYEKIIEEELIENQVDCNLHSTDKLIKIIIWVVSNILLNNYCTRENDNVQVQKHKHRKLSTVRT